jgi:KDO2-lipid IV(A) lauroyltransferase
MFKYFLYIVGRFITNGLPLNVAYKIAVFFSDLQYHFSPRDRKAVTENLKTILKTDRDVSPEVRQVFRNFGRYLAEFFKDELITKNYIKKNIEVLNIGYIDEVLKKGKGAIIVTGHIGNWELGGIVLGELGYPLMAIALPHKERPVNELFNAQRAKKGVTVVPTSVAVRRLIETLRANKIVALVADRDFGQHGEVMPFLGKDVLIPKGAAIFSLKTGAPIVPMFLVRKEGEKFVLMVEKPIEPPKAFKGAVPPDAVVDLIGRYLKVIENKVYAYPTQWLMFRRYWNEKATTTKQEKLVAA